MQGVPKSVLSGGPKMNRHRRVGSDCVILCRIQLRRSAAEGHKLKLW